jgi:hypothetical protein
VKLDFSRSQPVGMLAMSCAYTRKRAFEAIACWAVSACALWVVVFLSCASLVSPSAASVIATPPAPCAMATVVIQLQPLGPESGSPLEFAVGVPTECRSSLLDSEPTTHSGPERSAGVLRPWPTVPAVVLMRPMTRSWMGASAPLLI